MAEVRFNDWLGNDIDEALSAAAVSTIAVAPTVPVDAATLPVAVGDASIVPTIPVVASIDPVVPAGASSVPAVPIAVSVEPAAPASSPASPDEEMELGRCCFPVVDELGLNPNRPPAVPFQGLDDDFPCIPRARGYGRERILSEFFILRRVLVELAERLENLRSLILLEIWDDTSSNGSWIY